MQWNSAIICKMQLQLSAKMVCNFLQKGLAKNTLKINIYYIVAARQCLFQCRKRSGLTVLTRTVNAEIFTCIDKRLNVFHPLAYVNHVMLIRIADSRCVEFLHGRITFLSMSIIEVFSANRP